VESYRAYYMSPEKRRIAAWKKNRPAPEWYHNHTPAITTQPPTQSKRNIRAPTSNK
jgi:hypothetical protein